MRSLKPGTRLEPKEVAPPLGAGGLAEERIGDYTRAADLARPLKGGKT
jgi:hypothetical protein